MPRPFLLVQVGVSCFVSVLGFILGLLQECRTPLRRVNMLLIFCFFVKWIQVLDFTIPQFCFFLLFVFLVFGFCGGSAAVLSAEQPHVIVSMICICHSK